MYLPSLELHKEDEGNGDDDESFDKKGKIFPVGICDCTIWVSGKS